MAEINNPSKRTFWKTTGAEHEGFTDIDQVTTTGQPSMISDTDASTIFPALPSSGTLTEGDIYSYSDGMVIVIQTHVRTIYAPEDTPALFSVYRANNEGAAWIENEKVIGGDVRTHVSKMWICIQSHTTLKGWEPDKTPALWKEKIIVVETPVWKQPTGAHDAYKKGDRVHFPTISDPVYESLIDYNVYSPTAYPAGWRKVQCSCE